ncbi:uncharacterized protein BYT42DRAFT_368538 [Radiomyces spectabilis]|uniref:uncharacterized protein n=1 Tax=Radiomyces spectabilis TaxID=64574 RepID=UPI0022209892|nr:uncharacterized protein BYT42DRAFT_368538 [Radiomyces spectabilis]KAI8375938.1 hypothetical protein BYT42DRAFT_368538 [Radiomyces spectabilis]
MVHILLLLSTLASNPVYALFFSFSYVRCHHFLYKFTKHYPYPPPPLYASNHIILLHAHVYPKLHYLL